MTDTIANIFDDPSCHQIDTRLFFREVDVVDGGKRQGVVLATWNETYGNFALNCGEMERLLAGIHIDMDAFYASVEHHPCRLQSMGIASLNPTCVPAT
jgi:hypothetical protein